MAAESAEPPEFDIDIKQCELESGDVVLFVPGNGRAFIRADREVAVDLQGEESR